MDRFILINYSLQSIGDYGWPPYLSSGAIYVSATVVWETGTNQIEFGSFLL